MITSPPVVIITGASSGIGAVTAHLFAERGWIVVLAARSVKRLEAIANAINAANGQAVAIPTDITDWAQVGHLVQQTVDRFGHIEAVINNAGQGVYSTVTGLPPAELEKIFRLNTIAPMVMLQTVKPIMKQQGGGVVVNISTVLQNVALPLMGPYAASKIALSYLNDAARAELNHANIALVNILPGRTATPFGANIQDAGREEEFLLTEVEAWLEDYDQHGTPPEAVAETIWRAVQEKPRQQYVTRSGQLVGQTARLMPGLFNKLATFTLNRYVPRVDRAASSPQGDALKAGLLGGLATLAAVTLWLKQR